MPEFAIQNRCNFSEVYGDDASLTRGTAITAAGSANTKGSYAELVASTDVDARGFVVTICQKSSQNAQYSIDVAVGAASSEEIIIPDMVFAPLVSNDADASFFVPVKVAKGTRISARCQCTAASQNIRLVLHMIPEGLEGLQGMSEGESWGFDASNTRGQLCNPNTANSPSAWVELEASTAKDCRAIILSMDSGPDTAKFALQRGIVELGIGSSGNEELLTPPIPYIYDTHEGFAGMYPKVIPVSVPAGSRVTARCRCNATDVNAEVYVSAIGIS